LNYQDKFGVNPFQFGMVGAGDSHTGLREFRYRGQS
jgi:hypothetical protein